MSISNDSQESVAAAPQGNWTNNPFGASIAAGVIALEAAPVPINEGLRVAAGVAVFAVTHDAVASAAAAGAATALIEGGAGISTADLLHTKRGREFANKYQERLNELGSKIGLKEGVKTNLVTDAALTFLGGTAVSTFVKSPQFENRTRKDDRRYALRNAGGLTAYTFGASLMVMSGIEAPNPVTIGLSTLAVSGTIAAIKWAKNRITSANRSSEASGKDEVHIKNNNGQAPHRLGLKPEDIEAANNDERTMAVIENGIKKPVLVPIDKLYWYNKKYLTEYFGTDEIYYYAHPEISDEKIESESYKFIQDVVAKKGVVLYDTVKRGEIVFGDLDRELTDRGVTHQKADIAKDGKKSWLAQYEGQFVVTGRHAKAYSNDITPIEIYRQAVEKGKIKYNAQTGPALLDIIDGEDAERLWKIYEGPFEKLSATHPINSGYKREEFIEMLKDPETLKAVYRENGAITTLAFFVNNLDHCDWLDKSYYESHYPEAMKTKNIFVFPGIVTDELKRGGAFSVPIIDLLAKVQAMRKTPAIIAFECTETSSRYVPKIVQFSINKSGAAIIKDVKQEKSRLDYYAITA